MKIIRFIFPFLFARNWYSGEYEVSKSRLVLFGMFLSLLALGIVLISYLQAPITYTSTSL